ncbi:MAG: hypothetical protein U0L09_06870, partial [Christensenellales bacterium]|nr:hypothetical protein [Christensenellales bacterium]
MKCCHSCGRPAYQRPQCNRCGGTGCNCNVAVSETAGYGVLNSLYRRPCAPYYTGPCPDAPCYGCGCQPMPPENCYPWPAPGPSPAPGPCPAPCPGPGPGPGPGP